METILVVDGYNAINAIPEACEKLKKDLYAARKVMVAIVAEYARSSGYITDIRVVFDGDDRYRHMDARGLSGGRKQVFSRTGKGDDTIIETVKKCSACGKVVLASNDNYVRNNSRAYGASLIFVEELVRKKRRKKMQERIPGKEIDRGLRDEITREYKEELGL